MQDRVRGAAGNIEHTHVLFFGVVSALLVLSRLIEILWTMFAPRAKVSKIMLYTTSEP